MKQYIFFYVEFAWKNSFVPQWRETLLFLSKSMLAVASAENQQYWTDLLILEVDCIIINVLQITRKVASKSAQGLTKSEDATAGKNPKSEDGTKGKTVLAAPTNKPKPIASRWIN